MKNHDITIKVIINTNLDNNLINWIDLKNMLKNKNDIRVYCITFHFDYSIIINMISFVLIFLFSLCKIDLHVKPIKS